MCVIKCMSLLCTSCSWYNKMASSTSMSAVHLCHFPVHRAGWYNKGNFNYQSGFRGEVPFTSSDTTGRSTSAPQDASGFALRGTDVLPAPSDLSTLL